MANIRYTPELAEKIRKMIEEAGLTEKRYDILPPETEPLINPTYPDLMGRKKYNEKYGFKKEPYATDEQKRKALMIWLMTSSMPEKSFNEKLVMFTKPETELLIVPVKDLFPEERTKKYLWSAQQQHNAANELIKSALRAVNPEIIVALLGKYEQAKTLAEVLESIEELLTKFFQTEDKRETSHGYLREIAENLFRYGKGGNEE